MLEKDEGCIVRCIRREGFCWIRGGTTSKHHSTTDSLYSHSNCRAYVEDHKRRRLLCMLRLTHCRTFNATTDTKLETMLKKSIQERIRYMEERQLTLERFQLGNKWTLQTVKVQEGSFIPTYLHITCLGLTYFKR